MCQWVRDLGGIEYLLKYESMNKLMHLSILNPAYGGYSRYSINDNYSYKRGESGNECHIALDQCYREAVQSSD